MKFFTDGFGCLYAKIKKEDAPTYITENVKYICAYDDKRIRFVNKEDKYVETYFGIEGDGKIKVLSEVVDEDS